jgi:hypothetical protein
VRRRDLDVHTTLFVGGLHSSMIGFAVGALFAPEAYQFFPYFAVAYSSALVAIVREQGLTPPKTLPERNWRNRYGIVRANNPRPHDLTPVH